MSTVLFLVHRLPYPPNKGDKVRSYHLLMQLRQRHQVLLGTFVDDPEDEQYVSYVRSLCADSHIARLRPLSARIRSLRALFLNEPLSLAYYRDPELQAWLNRIRRQANVEAVLVFSSSMLAYTKGFAQPTVIDFADVDSDKWTEYGDKRAWPLSWIFRREGRLLQATERAGAALARWSVFATQPEAARFKSIAPESAHRTAVLSNGVDHAYFAPAAARPTPFPAEVVPLVFVGTMDYWPNVDAVRWLVQTMWPQLLQRWPSLRLYVVGRRPTRMVKKLACDSVVVTGTVADVRPFLQHARVVVAPVRLARGIQNKVLESMAMGRPVVASKRCADAIDATVNEHLLCADTADEYLRAISALLEAPARAESMGAAARQRVVDAYSWPAKLADLDRFLPTPAREAAYS